MTTSVSGKVEVKVSGNLTSSIDLGSNKYSFSESFSQSFANGTAANQVNAVFTDERSISGNDDLDLAGGLTDAHGNTLTFTSIKAIMIEANSANAANLIVGAEGSNPFGTLFNDNSDAIVVPPGGVFVLTNPAATGFAVTASTGDILRVAPASGTLSYKIVLLGEV